MNPAITPPAPGAAPVASLAPAENMKDYKGFKVNYTTGRAEKNIGGYTLTVTFPEGKGNEAKFNQFLDKFNQASIEKVIDVIKQIPMGIEKTKKKDGVDQKYTFKSFSFTFDKEGKVIVSKSYIGKKIKDMSDPKSYYEVKLQKLPGTDQATIDKKAKIQKKMALMQQLNSLVIDVFKAPGAIPGGALANGPANVPMPPINPAALNPLPINPLAVNPLAVNPLPVPPPAPPANPLPVNLPAAPVNPPTS